MAEAEKLEHHRVQKSETYSQFILKIFFIFFWVDMIVHSRIIKYRTVRYLIGSIPGGILVGEFCKFNYVTPSFLGSESLSKAPKLQVNPKSWISTYAARPVLCEETIIDEQGSVVLPKVLEKGAHNSADMSIESLPVLFRFLFMLICWSMLFSVWSCALAGPLIILCALMTGSWSVFANVLFVWLLAGFVKFPYFPNFSNLVSSGLEHWFDHFSIHYDKGSLPLVAKSRTIYCYHPHGLFSIGMCLLAVDLVRRGEPVAIVTSSHMRWFNPILKILLDIAGIEIVGSSPKEVQSAMRKGQKSLILVPGGYEEGVLTQSGFERLFLKDRLGFVKYAMRYNYTLTPVYAYGENDLYTTYKFASKLRAKLASWKIPLAVFHGHESFPLMPNKSGIRIVIGEPVMVQNNTDPDIHTLRFNHNTYVESLVKMYYNNNTLTDRPLEIF